LGNVERNMEKTSAYTSRGPKVGKKKSSALVPQVWKHRTKKGVENAHVGGEKSVKREGTPAGVMRLHETQYVPECALGSSRRIRGRGNLRLWREESGFVEKFIWGKIPRAIRSPRPRTEGGYRIELIEEAEYEMYEWNHLKGST